MARTISHTQYESLVSYEDGNALWSNGGTPRALVSAGLVRSDGLAREFYVITPAGSAALDAYRTRWGIRVAATREP
jgi:hypothetical protein